MHTPAICVYLFIEVKILSPLCGAMDTVDTAGFGWWAGSDSKVAAGPAADLSGGLGSDACWEFLSNRRLKVGPTTLGQEVLSGLFPLKIVASRKSCQVHVMSPSPLQALCWLRPQPPIHTH